MIDVANALDLEHPGALALCNTDSLGERLQRALPETKVVKTLSTMWCGLMVNPRMLKEPHTNFISGNDGAAKSKVVELLKTFGWQAEETVDLGGITGARGAEMLLPVWLHIWKTLGTGAFNLKIAR